MNSLLDAVGAKGQVVVVSLERVARLSKEAPLRRRPETTQRMQIQMFDEEVTVL